jgi:hypothetical protein
MKKHFFFFWIFLFDLVLVQSQDNKVSNPGYNIERNDPENIPKFGITAYPFMIQTTVYGSTAVCYGGDITWDIVPNFTIFGHGFKAYESSTVYDTKDALDLKPYQAINAGAVIFVSSKKVKDQNNIDAWYKKGFRMRINYLRDVTLDEVDKFGFEGGWYNSNSVAVGKLTRLSGYRIDDPDRQVYALNRSGNISNVSSTCIFGGMIYTVNEDFKISLSDPVMETAKLSGISNFYFDLLFPIKSDYSDVKVTDPSEAPPGTYYLNDNTARFRTGWRAGINAIVDEKPGISFSMEIGDQPCVPKNAFYFLFKIGLGFHV